ncbi:MAG: hypothetical protein PVH88_20095 [Ignavibacteria bacterium]|jgi:hypothetical protein
MLKSSITVLFLFLLFNSNALAQQETVKFPPTQLFRIVDMAETYVMFRIKDSKLYILDQDRKALYPKNYQAPGEEVYTAYTVEYILKQAGTKTITFIKGPNDVVRLGSNGDVTIKNIIYMVCPPHCP